MPVGNPEPDAPEVIAEVKARVTQLEKAMLRHRQKTGRRIVGRAGVLRQSWRASPTSPRPIRTLRPRFAGRVDVRVPALLSYRAFLASHCDARKAWLAGESARFPLGTYWLARFAPITVEPSPLSH